MSSTTDGAARHHNVPSTLPAGPLPTVQRSLARAVFERRDEYLTKDSLRIKIGSWNVAALDGTEKDLGNWFVQGEGIAPEFAGLDVEDKDGFSIVGQSFDNASQKDGTLPQPQSQDPSKQQPEADIYVLGLQEIVDISSATGALRTYNDTAAARKWRESMAEALPPGFVFIAEHQLIGLYSVIFASSNVAKNVSSVSTTSVGTGLMGYMGNKGAVAVRLVIGEVTKLVFVNSHLAAGNEKTSLERRNWDVSRITQHTKFDPVNHGNGIFDEAGDHLGLEHYAFWFGDLNYRLGSLPGEDVRRLLMLHTTKKYDMNREELKIVPNNLETDGEPDVPSTPHGTSFKFAVSEDSETDGDEGTDEAAPGDRHEQEKLDPRDDPASLQTTLASLLPHDQLHEQMRQHKAFHDGWREGPLHFLPTYKYDVGSFSVFDSSEKQRGPSWCDRILYRTRKDYLTAIEHAKGEELAKKRDAEMKARGLDENADDAVLFDYNPETDGANNIDDGLYDPSADSAASAASDESQKVEDDSLRLHYYTSYQKILSSDHKPLDALFELTCSVIDYKKKADVTSEVAKELDRDENEARPTLTLIVDYAARTGNGNGDIDFGQVRFDEPRVHNITIANTGSVTAHFGLVQDTMPDTYHRWLNLHFGADAAVVADSHKLYSIEPGDTMNATCVLRVADIDDVRSLNSHSASLDDVRILRVQNGRDHFLTSCGTWLNSCFGLSLDKLIRVPEEGVRSCALDKTLDEQPVRWSAPRELFRLTEALEESLERAVAEWGMKEEEATPPWETPGWPFVASTWIFRGVDRTAVNAHIREGLDSGSPFGFTVDLSATAKTECLAETLIAFLDSIEDGIINDELWTLLSNGLEDREKGRKSFDAETQRAFILEKLSVSSARSVAFTFITFMLVRIADELAPVPAEIPMENLSPVTKAAEIFKGRLTGRSGSLSGEQQMLAKRTELERKFAEAFGNVLFKVSIDGKMKEKKASEERRRSIIGTFLQRRGGNDRTL